jgi:hypothetical protein
VLDHIAVLKGPMTTREDSHCHRLKKKETRRRVILIHARVGERKGNAAKLGNYPRLDRSRRAYELRLTIEKCRDLEQFQPMT